jgi:hypothetical protein
MMRILAGALVLVFAADAAKAESCTSVQFQRGHSSTVVHGSAPADDTVCYAVTTGKGQRAQLKIVSGTNVVLSVDGLVDAQTAYSFTTERKTYHIIVGQLMRAVDPVDFTMSVAVK